MRNMAVWLAATVSCAVALAIPAGAAAGEGHYCEELVPAYTDCANNPGHSWDYWNGVVDVNAAEYYGEGTVNVCEHAYDRGNGDTVSDRCGNGFAGSSGDLAYYFEHNIELSSHAGNNSEHPHTIYGTIVN
jgi:hypothetical protein